MHSCDTEAKRPLLFSAHKTTRVVTEINGHRDKRSSEIMAQKQLNGLNNNKTQIKCYGKHCLSICS